MEPQTETGASARELRRRTRRRPANHETCARNDAVVDCGHDACIDPVCLPKVVGIDDQASF